MKKKIIMVSSLISLAIILGIAAIVIFSDTSKAALIESLITQVDAENTEENGGEIASKSFEFINANPNIFPTEDLAAIEPLVDKGIRAKDLNKNFDKEAGRLFENHGEVYEIFEVTWGSFESGKDKLVTYILVEDFEGYNYELFYLEKTNIEIGVSNGDKIPYNNGTKFPTNNG